MKKAGLILVAIFLTLASLSQAQDDTSLPEVRARDEKGEVEVDAEGNIASQSGIIATYKDVILTADSARLGTNEIHASGNVTVQWSRSPIQVKDAAQTNQPPAQYWTADELVYNYRTGEIRAGNYRTTSSPLFITGEGLTVVQTNETLTATNSIITSDNYFKPGHRIKAKRIKVHGNEFVEMWDTTMYVGNVPVFYFPYYRRSLGRHPYNWEITPGYRSLYGPYILNSFNIYWNQYLDGALHLDYRERRGFGFGPQLNWQSTNWGRGSFQYYYTYDQKPDVGVRGQPLKNQRDRFNFAHQVTLRTNLTVKAVVRYQSDEYIIRDFFENEHLQNVQPNTFIEATKLWSNWTLDALVQPRVNPFFETVERLPDIKLSGLRQQLGISPFFYEGESSFGYYRRKFADHVLPEYSAYRGDSYHQIVLPQTYFGWLNFTPRAGGRFTYYSEAEGPGATTREQTRAVFNTGAELSTKMSRIWTGAQSTLLDVNELRHIFEPSVNYVYVPSPNRLPPRLPQFDYEIPSLRLLPIDYPDYNAIDAIDSQNVLRITLRNKLQTKREKSIIDNLVNWSLYTDWRIKPRSTQSTFADFYSDLDLKPRTWLTLNSETRFDVYTGIWKEANHTLFLQPNATWAASIGHRYLKDDPTFGPDSGHNLITTSLYYKLNENWGARISHRFEARDGKMEEQFYTIYRDLRSWTTALTFRLREGRNSRHDDFTVAISISLKAFPRFGLGKDRDHPQSLVGY